MILIFDLSEINRQRHIQMDDDAQYYEKCNLNFSQVSRRFYRHILVAREKLEKIAGNRNIAFVYFFRL